MYRVFGTGADGQRCYLWSRDGGITWEKKQALTFDTFEQAREAIKAPTYSGKWGVTNRVCRVVKRQKPGTIGYVVKGVCADPKCVYCPAYVDRDGYSTSKRVMYKTRAEAEAVPKRARTAYKILSVRRVHKPKPGSLRNP